MNCKPTPGPTLPGTNCPANSSSSIRSNACLTERPTCDGPKGFSVDPPNTADRRQPTANLGCVDRPRGGAGIGVVKACRRAGFAIQYALAVRRQDSHVEARGIRSVTNDQTAGEVPVRAPAQG